MSWGSSIAHKLTAEYLKKEYNVGYLVLFDDPTPPISRLNIDVNEMASDEIKAMQVKLEAGKCMKRFIDLRIPLHKGKSYDDGLDALTRVFSDQTNECSVVGDVVNEYFRFADEPIESEEGEEE